MDFFAPSSEIGKKLFFAHLGIFSLKIEAKLTQSIKSLQDKVNQLQFNERLAMHFTSSCTSDRLEL